MLLTRNGRFNSDSFYTEAPRFSQDNAYDSSLFTAVKNALYQNFGITTKTLLKWKPNYSKTGNLPEDVKKYIKTPEAPAQPQAAPQTPAAAAPTEAQDNPPTEITDQSAQPATDESVDKNPTSFNNIKSEAVKWTDVVSRVGNNPVYYSITPNKDGTFTITKNKSGSMLVAYDNNITESMSILYLVPNPVSFNKPELFKNGIPDIIKPYFDVSGNGLISMVTPVAFATENKSGPWKMVVKGFIELTENDVRPLKKANEK